MASFAARRVLVIERRRRREVERLARMIALAHTGFDPETLVVSDHIVDARIRGGFRVPYPAHPLWHGFIAAAEAVLADRSA